LDNERKFDPAILQNEDGSMVVKFFKIKNKMNFILKSPG